MATASGNLAAGKALAGQGGKGNNGRYGLKAKVLAGVAILGCAAALVFGGLRANDSGQSQSRSAATAPVVQADIRDQQHFLEQNLNLPSANQSSDWNTTRFIEENQLPEIANSTTSLDWYAVRMIEQNQLPETANNPPDSCQPGQFTPCER